MKLPLYFISDVHFQMTNSKQEKLRRKKMYSLFKKIQNTGGTLIIGGDFFDFWYDYGYYIAPEYSDVFDELDKLNQSGINIHYVAGNHDYWDFGFFKKKFKAKFYKNDQLKIYKIYRCSSKLFFSGTVFCITLSGDHSLTLTHICHAGIIVS
mgnify:CR=1 FL=1